MKNILKLFLVPLMLMTFSCEVFDLDKLDSPNAITPDKADLNLFFNNIQLDYAIIVQNASDLTMPSVRMMAMTGGNVYDNAISEAGFNFIWRTAYADLLPDLRALSELALATNQFEHLAVAKIMEAHTLMILVDLFGDIPYTQTLQGTNELSPAADDDAGLYEKALSLLNEAADDFGKESSTALNDDDPNINDLFYSGNEDNWIRLINSLKLRYYLTTRLVNGNAISEIQNLVNENNLILDASQDFVAEYGTERLLPDSRHPFYVRHYETDNGPYLSNDYIWSLLAEKGFEDPRLRYYFYRQDCNTTDENQFTLDCANTTTSTVPAHYQAGVTAGFYPWCIASETGWWGRDHGNDDGIPPDGTKRSVYGLYPGGGSFDADNCTGVKNEGADGAGGAGITPIMLSSFVQFMIAEAMNVAGDDAAARAALEAGIRASMAKVASFNTDNVPADFAMTTDTVDYYVNVVLEDYDTTDDKLNVIAEEYHIALWGQGLEAYNMYRRTSKPTNLQPTRQANSGNFPRTMLYPADYVNLNAKATQRIITDKVFWDTNTNPVD